MGYRDPISGYKMPVYNGFVRMYIYGRFVEVEASYVDADPSVGLSGYMEIDDVRDVATGESWNEEDLAALIESSELLNVDRELCDMDWAGQWDWIYPQHLEELPW